MDKHYKQGDEHQLVESMMCKFMAGRGYETAPHELRRSLLKGRYLDDIFINVESLNRVICEYKSPLITSHSIFEGLSQSMYYYSETGLHIYLVLHSVSYDRHKRIINLFPYLGLFLYQDYIVSSYRKPLNTIDLPSPNEIITF